MFEEYFTRILLAALVGGLVGLEREYRDKSAGFRTMILIAIGSALFTILADIIGGPDEDSARIASSVVSGVGFLGAGVIIKDGSRIKGLTTAASIWLVASLGMGMGAGEVELVLAVTSVVLVVLWVIPPVERWIDSKHEFTEFVVTITNSDKVEADVLEVFNSTGVKIVHIGHFQSSSNERQLHIKAKSNSAQHAQLTKKLVNKKSILSVSH